jgi:cell division protein ZapA
MAQVTIRINGYGYTLGCQDGEEKHLESMADQVNRRIDAVRASAGPSGEARMLLMAALILADEIHDLQKGRPVETKPDPKLGQKLSRIAKRAEEIADRLETPETP